MQNFQYGDKYAAFLHDAVLLYAIALNEAMTQGLDCDRKTAVSLHADKRLRLRDSVVSGVK